MRTRVVGIIIKEGQILLMHRVKNGEEYYVLPGGGIEENENTEDALKREIKEELSLDISKHELAFEIDNKGSREIYYLITNFNGTPKLGGPEKEKMNEQNQYYPEWFNLVKASELKNLLPREAVDKIRRLLATHPSPEYRKAIPRKRMASGVLLFNKEEKLLIVKPSYKDYWSMPGGIIDANESPRQTALREVTEEIGIQPEQCQFLCLDYISAEKERDEMLEFTFYGGKLDQKQIENIKIDEDEISDYKFVDTDEAMDLFGGKGSKLGKKLPKYLEALKQETVIYLENGEE